MKLRALALLLILLLSSPCHPYSVQTHEQLIDLTWKSSILPLLRERYPTITDSQLLRAHAYAYGGSAIQDIGYYPFGNAFFSDLAHYVRSGDFVRSLLRNSHTPNELAFAIGALSHYVGDSIGHSQAVNPSVAVEFPSLEKQYGPIVTYEDNPHAHVRTEFAFDINEISKHRFAPSAYLRHIGLEVPEPLLARAFYETYGLDLRRILGGHRPIVRGYRFSVRSFLPRIAYAETLLHRNSFPADTQNADLTQLEQALALADFENGWNQYRKRAGLGTYTLAGLIYIAPKVGTLSMLAIRGPNTDTEQRYVKSVNRTTEALRRLLESLNTTTFNLANRDLDTGAKVRPGAYRLTDETYAKLLDVITHSAQPIPAGLKGDILNYYSDPAAPISTKQDPRKWARVQSELARLQTLPTRAEPDIPALEATGDLGD